MNILITGIHGFVGSNLVMALKSRHTLYGLDIVATEKDGVIKTFSWEDIKPESFSFQNFSKLPLDFAVMPMEVPLFPYHLKETHHLDAV